MYVKIDMGGVVRDGTAIGFDSTLTLFGFSTGGDGVFFSGKSQSTISFSSEVRGILFVGSVTISDIIFNNSPLFFK